MFKLKPIISHSTRKSFSTNGPLANIFHDAMGVEEQELVFGSDGIGKGVARNGSLLDASMM